VVVTLWGAAALLFGALFLAELAGFSPAVAEEKADDLWESSPVIASHTHLDPDKIKLSINELINAGVTAAVLNLTIDDGDFMSSKPGWVSYGQDDTRWGERFEERLGVLEALEKQGVLIIARRLADIPRSQAEVRVCRRQKKIAIIIASEGSNHIEGARQAPPDGPATRDAAPKTITLRSISAYKKRGWLSTALVHQVGPGEKGHRLLRPDGLGLNDFGRFMALTLFSEGILVDLPHMSGDVVNELLDIAAIQGRPVMISHENPLSLREETLRRIAKSGGGAGLVGVHSYKGYLSPPTIENYVKVIDESCKRFEKLGIKPGDQHIALGLDWFFHADMKPNDWAGRSPGTLRLLVPLLKRQGYTGQQIRNILGENMLRLLECAWKK
jgi:microsomal dipeptidase-like Zn-dependent dipeptidase